MQDRVTQQTSAAIQIKSFDILQRRKLRKKVCICNLRQKLGFVEFCKITKYMSHYLPKRLKYTNKQLFKKNVYSQINQNHQKCSFKKKEVKIRKIMEVYITSSRQRLFQKCKYNKNLIAVSTISTNFYQRLIFGRNILMKGIKLLSFL